MVAQTTITNTTTLCLSGAQPVNLAEVVTCNRGFYCPNNTVDHPPQYCPPTTECQITRLQTLYNTCSMPQGTYEPIPCAPGFYCPSGGLEQLPCPARHYCPSGSFRPWQCSSVSACSPSSPRQYPLIGVIALMIIDVVILFAALGPLLRRQWRSRRKQKEWPISHDREGQHENSSTDSCEQVEELQLMTDEKSFRLQKFVQSLQRCIGLSNIDLEIGFDNLGLQIEAGGKTILSGVSGNVKPGSLLGVMGPSGAGKSTFVRLMMGKLRQTSGTISINRTPGNLSDFKKIIGYVPQDDTVMPELTVKENLLHSARIRLPSTWTQAEIEEHVDMLIACLELTGIEKNIVGDLINPGISGGQRKRVSIGIELAAAPMVLILDEPTSGLDSTSALAIMKLLMAICRLGVTIACIIHQPRLEIFECLDQLLLLADGREVYFGKAGDAAEYFKTAGFDVPVASNPADVIMDIICGRGQKYATHREDFIDGSSRLVSHWAINEHKHKAAATEGGVTEEKRKQLSLLLKSISARGASWHRQVGFCFVRSVRQQSRQLKSFFLEIFVGAVAGLLIGLSVYRLNGLLFQGVFVAPFELLSSAVNYTLVPQLGLLCSLAIGLAAAAPGVKTFGEEKTIYWREASSGHSRSAYFVGKVLSTLFRLSLSALHFTAFYAILATPIMAFSMLYAANLLYFYCIYGLACCVSMVTRRENGPLLAMIVSLIIGVFGGYGPPLSTIKIWHLEWLWRMCPGTWFSEAYFHAHTAPLRYLYDIDSAASWTGYTVNHMGLDMGMLLIIGTVYRILAFGGLVGFDRDQQV